MKITIVYKSHHHILPEGSILPRIGEAVIINGNDIGIVSDIIHDLPTSTIWVILPEASKR